MQLVTPTKGYSKDSHLIYSCQYHVIFCPKYRRPVLKKDVKERLEEILIKKQEEYKYKIIEMDIMSDHVHLLMEVSPKDGIYWAVSKIKGYTSRTLRNEFPHLKKKIPSLWTLSRFISSVGSVELETVKRYIKEQKDV